VASADAGECVSVGCGLMGGSIERPCCDPSGWAAGGTAFSAPKAAVGGSVSARGGAGLWRAHCGDVWIKPVQEKAPKRQDVRVPTFTFPTIGYTGHSIVKMNSALALG
jgi:hypothetical protein